MGYFEMIYRSELSHRARAVYMYLKDHADKDGQCWPGLRTIAAELKLSRSTVKPALAGERKPQFQSVPAHLSIETDSPAKGRVRAFCEPSLGP